MGIDIYAAWRGQTAAESDAQVTGFSAWHGDVGYLREAYHGGPYVTKYLLAEAFASVSGEAAIPSHTLRERLPTAVLMHLYREQKVYGNGKDPSRIEVADVAQALRNVGIKEIADVSHKDFAAALTAESIATAHKLIAGNMLPESAQAFVDFVELCERKERETGEPVRIIASY